MKINELYISKDHPNMPKGNLETVLAFIIHYTANDSPKATDTANARYIGRIFKTKNGVPLEFSGKTFRYGSAHTFCDEDSITRVIPYNKPSYGCGDRQLPYNNGYKGQTKIAKEIFNYRQNFKTINIEICNNGDWEKSVNNAIEEIVYVINTYKYPAVFYRHYDITGKICPKPLIDETKWNEFKNKIIAKLNPPKEIDKLSEIKQELIRSLKITKDRTEKGETIQDQINWLKIKFEEYTKLGGK